MIRTVSAAVLLAAMALAPASAQDLTAGPSARLRHLPAAERGWRLDGELDRRDFVMTLTEAEARGARSLDLALRSAVSVHPEASRLAVEVNGRALDPVVLGEAVRSRRLSVALPEGVLQAGVNLIRIEARLRHRVDCSVKATYELWVEIDPAASGLVLDGAVSARAAAGDLAAAAADEAGRLRLTAVLGRMPDEATLDRLAAGLQAVALASGTRQPLVEWANRPGSGPGLDLALGSPGELAALYPGLAPGQGGEATLAGAADRRRLLLAGVGPGEIDSALASLAATAGPAAEAAERARSRIMAEGARSASFAEAGLASFTFDGRLARFGFELVMPTDFYPSDTGFVTIRLAGGYRGGLAAGAALSVSVDGERAADLPLIDPKGGLFEGRELRLPLGRFRPGANRVEFEVALPAAADDVCDGSGTGEDRLLILETSRIEVPPLPRIARVPDLKATLAGGGGQAVTIVHVPRPDAQSLAAALTLVTRMAVEAGRPVPVSFRFRLPAPETGRALILGAWGDLPPAWLARFGLDAAERSADSRVRRTGPASLVTGAMPVRNDVPARAEPPARPDPAELYRAWRKPSAADGVVARLSAAGEALFADLVGQEAAPLRPSPATSLAWVEIVGPAGQAPWTLVSAPSTEMLVEGLAEIGAPERWRRIAGGRSFFAAGAGRIDSDAPARPLLVATRPADLANWRLVAAGWLSHRPFAYAGLLLSLILVFAGTSTAVLARSGQKDGAQ